MTKRTRIGRGGRPGIAQRASPFLCLGAVLFVLGCPAEDTNATPKNVLLVVLDTVRADRLSTYGYSVETSPNLSALALRGARFDDVVSTSAWTLPAHASLMTGLSVSEHGATHEHRALRKGAETLAGRLSRAGFRTAGFSTNPNVSAITRLDQGFDRFEYFAGPGGEVTRRVLDFTKQSDEPWFVFANFMEAHMPYNGLPDPVRQRFLPGSTIESHGVALQAQADSPYLACGVRALDDDAVARLGRLYDAAIVHVDDQLGRLLAGLGDEIEDTLVVVVSDHGELLGEHGRLEHQYSLLEPLLQIPMVVSWPAGIEAGLAIDMPLDLAQVHDVILHLTGVEPGGGPWGVSARAERVAEYDRPVNLVAPLRAVDPDCAERLDARLTSVRQGRFKLVLSAQQGAQLFDLDTDPEETRDVAARHPKVAAALEAIARRRQAKERDAGDRIPPLNAEVRDRLEELGYIREEPP